MRTPCFNCGGIREFWKHPVFKGVRPLGRGTLKMRSGRNTIHLIGEFDNSDFLFRTVHAANQLCTYGADTKLCEKQPEADSGKASKGGPESARRTPREILIKQEERKLLGDIPRLPPPSGNRMLQNLENFESMPFMSKIDSLRAAAKFHHPIEIENYYVTTLLVDDGWRRRTSMWKEYTAPRNQKDSRPFASIDANQKMIQSWILDLPWLLMFLAWRCKYHHWVIYGTQYGFWQVVVKQDSWTRFIVTSQEL